MEKWVLIRGKHAVAFGSMYWTNEVTTDSGFNILAQSIRRSGNCLFL